MKLVAMHGVHSSSVFTSVCLFEMTSQLSQAERVLFRDAVIAALPWRKNAVPDPLLLERYECIEQSLVLQVMHNDLQLRSDRNDSERERFLLEVLVPRLVEHTLRSIAQPGAPVGIESATATGRISTQMNLNTFHARSVAQISFAD